MVFYCSNYSLIIYYEASLLIQGFFLFFIVLLSKPLEVIGVWYGRHTLKIKDPHVLGTVYRFFISEANKQNLYLLRQNNIG